LSNCYHTSPNQKPLFPPIITNPEQTRVQSHKGTKCAIKKAAIDNIFFIDTINLYMFTHEEKQELKNIIDAKLKPVIDKLEAIHGQLNTLMQGEISTATGIDAMNDDEREKSKHNHH